MPLIPFVDLVGKVGTVAPAQTVSDVPKLNVVVSIGLTDTVKVVGAAH